MSKIYTKLGDSGDTSLIGGKRVRKNFPAIEAYGIVDELNSVIGLVRVSMVGLPQDKDLEVIQNLLFNLGGILATPIEDKPRSNFKENVLQITQTNVTWLEKNIDTMTKKLPKLRNFILPGGCEAAARIHIARCITRRLERYLVGANLRLPSQVLPFINRLSDYLFVLARYVNMVKSIPDVIWEK